jgi:hypothetical protein
VSIECDCGGTPYTGHAEDCPTWKARKAAWKASKARRATAAAPQASAQGSVERLVTMQIAVERGGAIHSDLQTHDNSYAEVAKGLSAIRSEIERVFVQQRECPHFPASKEDANKKIVRATPAAQDGGQGDHDEVLRLARQAGFGVLTNFITPPRREGHITPEMTAFYQAARSAPRPVLTEEIIAPLFERYIKNGLSDLDLAESILRAVREGGGNA